MIESQRFIYEKKYDNARIKRENCLVLAYQAILSSGEYNSVNFQPIRKNLVSISKGGFPVMAETTRNHIFSKEISQVIIAAMVLAAISIEKIVCE